MGTRHIATFTEADLQRRLADYEVRFQMSSLEFFRKWEHGELTHTDDFFDWAGLCVYLGVTHEF